MPTAIQKKRNASDGDMWYHVKIQYERLQPREGRTKMEVGKSLDGGEAIAMVVSWCG